MAKLTALELPAARRLAARYGLDVAHVEALEAGSVNSNFRLTTAQGGRFFLRVYEEQDMHGAGCELTLLTELAALGVPTTVPLVVQDEGAGGVSLHSGKPVALYPWIEGESLCQGMVTSTHTFALGEALARVHCATTQLSAVPQGRFGVAGLLERLALIQRRDARFFALGAELEVKLRDYASRRSARLPRGLTHGDLFRDNVLWTAAQESRPVPGAATTESDASGAPAVADVTRPRIAALIDFESAAEAPLLFDLMVCVQAWCYRQAFDTELVAALVAGYERVRPLLPEERGQYVVEGALGALRFAITRITDFSFRAPEGTAPLRDYRRFLSRLAELESGALATVFGS